MPVPRKQDKEKEVKTKVKKTSPRSISMSQLSMSPYLHLSPINLVVCKGPYLLAQREIWS